MWEHSMGFKVFYESIQQWAINNLWVGKTTLTNKHEHTYSVNYSGDGSTVKDNEIDHQHEIVGWDVKISENHIHEIPKNERQGP